MHMYSHITPLSVGNNNPLKKENFYKFMITTNMCVCNIMCEHYSTPTTKAYLVLNLFFHLEYSNNASINKLR